MDRVANLARQRQPGRRRSSGFTLIEIMVVVVILGILAALIAPNLFEQVDRAQLTKVSADIRTIEEGLALYRLSHFRYPTTDQGLEALVKQPPDPNIKNYPKHGYLPRVPKDPWGYTYHYLSPGDNGVYDIFTYGADGQIGGEDLDADIGNWSLYE